MAGYPGGPDARDPSILGRELPSLPREYSRNAGQASQSLVFFTMQRTVGCTMSTLPLGRARWEGRLVSCVFYTEIASVTHIHSKAEVRRLSSSET